MRRLLVLTLLALLIAPAFAGLENAQKISELRVNESFGGFLLKFPASAEAQVIYAWAFAVAIGMVFTWFGKWKLGQADARYFVDNFRWTAGSLVAALSVGVGGIASGVFETSSGEFVGWWSVLYHGGVAGAAIDWAVNKQEAQA